MKCRKAIATVAAVATMTSMLGMTAFASETVWNVDGAKSTVEGDTWVQLPTIEVELPGDLSFGINPLKLNVSETETADTRQIVSGEYYVTNYSDIPVAVKASTFLTVATDVEVYGKDDMVAAKWDTANGKTGELVSSTGKRAIWLVQLYPTAITMKEGAPSMDVTAVTQGTTVGADVLGDTLVAGTDESAVAKAPIFVLDAYKEADAVKSIAGFKFDGAVDPNGAFVDSDVKVKTVFELKTLTTDKKGDYEAYKAGNNVGGYYTTIMQEKAAAGGTP